jgi:hypothetical protein
MGQIKFEMDELRYATLFSQQHGYGMPKYRGSPMSGGSFWGKIIGFAKGLFSKAAPHLSSMLSKAQPHLKSFAGKTADSLIDTTVEKVNEKLKMAQEGKGIKGRRKKSTTVKKVKRKVKAKRKVTRKRRRSKFDLLADRL